MNRISRKNTNFLKICFVGSDVYPILNPNLGESYIGGESVQLTLLAKAFRDLGYEVSLLDKDYGQGPFEVVSGISVISTFRPDSGIPGLRFFYPRLSSIWQGLSRANADVYYQSTAGMITGVVSFFCKVYNRRFIFRTAHDTDCIAGSHLLNIRRDKIMYAYGLRNADIIAVQGVYQQHLLKKHYNLYSLPVNMTVEIPELSEDTNNRDIDVLWVNNMRPFKRPDLAIAIAKLLPKYRFVMIGGPCPGLSPYYEDIKQKARSVNNLEFLGPIPYHEVNSYFFRSKLFLNTSDIEGFPNSFLQSWIRSVPVVSFFDPDGLIQEKGLGRKIASITESGRAITELLTDDSVRLEIGATAAHFATANYSPFAVACHYIRLLNENCRTK